RIGRGFELAAPVAHHPVQPVVDGPAQRPRVDQFRKHPTPVVPWFSGWKNATGRSARSHESKARGTRRQFRAARTFSAISAGTQLVHSASSVLRKLRAVSAASALFSSP